MTSTPLTAKAKGLLWCLLVYAVAGGVALGAWFFWRQSHPLLVVALADTAATVAVFAFSLLLGNSSLYDPYWSVAPLPIAGYWLWLAPAEANPWRQGAVLFLLALWALRLTFNWLRQWRGLEHEDWRYQRLRERSGRAWPLVNFFGIHYFPTALVYGGCLSLLPALHSSRPFHLLDGLALLVTAAAIAIEALADHQLHRFVASGPAPEDILQSGLWAWSRHPNYFGEVLFWWGLFLFALAAQPSSWWTLVGPAAMTLLFLTISIPLIDRRMVERRPAYAEHKRRVSRLIPWPPSTST